MVKMKITADQFSRASKILRDNISVSDCTLISTEIKKNSKDWWAGYHHGWGTGVRNILRQNNFTDKESPSGNLDDIYIELVEHFIKEGHDSFGRLL